MEAVQGWPLPQLAGWCAGSAGGKAALASLRMHTGGLSVKEQTERHQCSVWTTIAGSLSATFCHHLRHSRDWWQRQCCKRLTKGGLPSSCRHHRRRRTGPKCQGCSCQHVVWTAVSAKLYAFQKPGQEASYRLRVQYVTKMLHGRECGTPCPREGMVQGAACTAS